MQFGVFVDRRVNANKQPARIELCQMLLEIARRTFRRGHADGMVRGRFVEHAQDLVALKRSKLRFAEDRINAAHSVSRPPQPIVSDDTRVAAPRGTSLSVAWSTGCRGRNSGSPTARGP